MTGHFVIHEYEISHPARYARSTHTDTPRRFTRLCGGQKWSGRLLSVLQMAQVCVCLQLI
jgi:hypothetical protein